MTRIEVTAEDIAGGDSDDCERCPIALALRRAFPSADYVAATEVHVEIGTTIIPLPWSARVFSDRFDRGPPVEPIVFEIETPDEE